jgi:4,5-dihydroxyphthalate decarboxylase
MIKQNAFDVAEMSATTYLSLRPGGRFPFVAIPVFPSRVFRHGFIYINTRTGIESPKDLEGRRIGSFGYGQTAAVWIRGILKDEYGVDLSTARWFEIGEDPVKRAPDHGKVPERRVPVPIEWVGQPASMSDLLAQGKIDALIGAQAPGRWGAIRRWHACFNYRDVERDYYRRTKIFPSCIMVIGNRCNRKTLDRGGLFKAFNASTTRSAAARSLIRRSGRNRLHFRRDPWEYGLEPNRENLGALARYLHEQGFVDQAIDIDKLFVPMVGGH